MSTAEWFAVPADCTKPKQIRPYITAKLAKDGTRTLYGRISVRNGTGHWFGCNVLIMRDVTEQEDTMLLRRNLRGLMEVRYG